MRLWKNECRITPYFRHFRPIFILFFEKPFFQVKSEFYLQLKVARNCTIVLRLSTLFDKSLKQMILNLLPPVKKYNVLQYKLLINEIIS